MKTLIRVLIVGVFFVAGCTAEKSATPALTASTETTKATSSTCLAGDVSVFDRADFNLVDIEREALPHGLYLATATELLIDKKGVDGSLQARMMVREVPGSNQAEVNCAENVDQLGDGFELSVAGVVKFETKPEPQGTGFVSRQFYVYADKAGYGVVLSSPRLGRPSSLKQAFHAGSGVQIGRLDERTFLVKYLKERDGVRARLMVKLELIPES